MAVVEIFSHFSVYIFKFEKYLRKRTMIILHFTYLKHHHDKKANPICLYVYFLLSCSSYVKRTMPA